jgi:cysteine-rich repeat protein
LGGTSTTIDVCSLVTDVCGDGYKKTTENCEDGNAIDGDGCSALC